MAGSSKKGRPKNKIAIVTGASGFLGGHITSALSEAGYVVIINYLHDITKAEKLRVYGELYQADVNDYAQFSRMVEDVVQRYDKLDLLVNNYGPILYRNMSEIPPEDFSRIISQNLMPAFYGCKIASEVMKPHKSGRIVNIAAAGADDLRPKKRTTPYYIAKNGVVMLTRSFAIDLAPHGITVNSVSPGIMREVQDAEEGALRDGFEIPMGRKGEPSEVASAVLFLAGDEAAYITGENINVSGGWQLK